MYYVLPIQQRYVYLQLYSLLTTRYEEDNAILYLSEDSRPSEDRPVRPQHTHHVYLRISSYSEQSIIFEQVGDEHELRSVPHEESDGMDGVVFGVPVDARTHVLHTSPRLLHQVE